MNQLQKILLVISLAAVSAGTCCGMWAVWAEDREYAGKTFWSLMILLAGCLVAVGVDSYFRNVDRFFDRPPVKPVKDA